jgi:hypothetical protein
MSGLQLTAAEEAAVPPTLDGFSAEALTKELRERMQRRGMVVKIMGETDSALDDVVGGTAAMIERSASKCHIVDRGGSTLLGIDRFLADGFQISSHIWNDDSGAYDKEWSAIVAVKDGKISKVASTCPSDSDTATEEKFRDMFHEGLCVTADGLATGRLVRIWCPGRYCE